MIVEVLLEGNMPLMVCSQRSMNYRDEKARALAELTSTRGKTIDDRMRISDLEFELSLYYDEKIGPYLPAFNVKRCFTDGAKHYRLGTHVQQALRSLPGQDRFPILYDGPRDLASMIQDASLRDVRHVGVSGRTVERTRAKFFPWKIHGRYILDEERLDLSKFRSCVARAGLYIGFGEFRLGEKGDFGTFTSSVKEIKLDASEYLERQPQAV